jgi:hypothetical protein
MAFKIVKTGQHTSSKMSGKSWAFVSRMVETPLGNTEQTAIKSFDTASFKGTVGQEIDHAATEALFDWK